jgi:hypothetical protein
VRGGGWVRARIGVRVRVRVRVRARVRARVRFGYRASGQDQRGLGMHR